MSITYWNIEEITGYHPCTTFWQDFSIADAFSTEAIQDTFNRAFAEWKTNTKFVTELSMVLNHKIWYWYDVHQKALKHNVLDTRANEYSKLYDNLWRKTDEWCMKHLKGSDLTYYIQTTDLRIVQ